MASIRGSITETRSLDSSAPYEITATLPTHESGDLLIVYLMFDRGDIDTSNTPTGWTQLFSVKSNDLRYQSSMECWYKEAESSSETDPAFILDETFEDSYKSVAIAIQDHNGIDVYATDSDASNNKTDMDAPSVTTTEDNCLVIRTCNHKNLGSSNVLSATPSTEAWLDPGTATGGDGYSPGHGGSYETQATAGATGAATFSGTGLYRPVSSTVAIKNDVPSTITFAPMPSFLRQQIDTPFVKIQYVSMNKAWKKAQKWEREWHGSCVNSLGEELKQLTYAEYMGLKRTPNPKTAYSFDLQGKSIVDIGSGPYSLLLKCVNFQGIAVDPLMASFPGWVKGRYIEHGVFPITAQGEKIDLIGDTDEVWIYNVLEHTYDPEKIIKNAKKISKIIRIFEWLDTPPSIGHPQTLRREKLDLWLGGEGKVEEIRRGGAVGRAYYGIFKGDRYE